MIKKLSDNIKDLDKDVLKIMFSGFKFSFFICLLSSIVLLAYIINPISYILFESGIILFKTGLTFAVSFFICGFVINCIKKQIT